MSQSVNSSWHSSVATAMGKETGFPLILCSHCGLTPVIELRSKKDNANFGRVFFKCARNGIPKMCDYFRFQTEYFEDLKRMDIVNVPGENFIEHEDEDEPFEEANIFSKAAAQHVNKELGMKISDVEWKIRVCICCLFVLFCEVVSRKML